MKAVLRISAPVLLCISTGAYAETLGVDGWYAANNHDAAMLQSIAIGNFGGNQGGDLASALERRLASGTDREGNRYFDIRSGYNGSAVDGVFDGQMNVRVDTVPFKTKKKRCIADHDSTDCKDDAKEDVELKCSRRTVSASADVRIVRISDDRVIYTRALPQKRDDSWCTGEDLPPSVDSVVDPFIRTITSEVAGDVLPYGKREKIRIRESRTGLSKPDSEQMKALILTTDKNPGAACAGWGEMESRGVSHPTLSFNLGLCAESKGELDRALGYYRAVDTASKKQSADVRDALARVDRRIAGEMEADARQAARGS